MNAIVEKIGNIKEIKVGQSYFKELKYFQIAGWY